VVARDLLWSDPGQSCDMGFTDHPARGIGVFKIGPDAVKKFLDRNNVQLIVRGHECVSLGFAFNSAGRVMTLFSAINYCGDGRNSGAILDIGKDLVCIPKIIRHVQDPARQMLVVRGENRLKESMHGDLEESGESGKLLAVALFPFHKEKPLELSMTVGDVLEVLNQDVSDNFFLFGSYFPPLRIQSGCGHRTRLAKLVTCRATFLGDISRLRKDCKARFSRFLFRNFAAKSKSSII
jgi:hypothetical protein